MDLNEIVKLYSQHFCQVLIYLCLSWISKSNFTKVIVYNMGKNNNQLL